MLQRNVRESKYKRYVDVIVHYPAGLEQSHAQILRIQFSDGSVWVVDKTYKGYRAAAQKAGGMGILYPIMATPKPLDAGDVPGEQREFHLFHDEDEWFVELDEPEWEER